MMEMQYSILCLFKLYQKKHFVPSHFLMSLVSVCSFLSSSERNFDNVILFQEKRTFRPPFSAERIYGGNLLAVCSNDFVSFFDWAECKFIRRIDVSVKV